MAELRTTPLTDWHRAHGARIVPFAGFAMPVQYGSALDEVKIVRNEAGLFDLCHMGRLVLTGPERVEAADHVLSQNVAEKIPESAIRYSLICTPEGGVVDDVLVYKEPDRLHVVINAGGRDEDPDWLREHTEGFDCAVEDVSDEQAMIALQGPRAKEILPKVCDADLSALKYYRFTRANVLDGVEALVSRTGYTGEDGFELFFSREHAEEIWEAVATAGGKPCGLGARDVCRTEAGMPLYGHEMNREITGLEAGLDFGIDLSKDFIGADALRAQRDAGVPRRLVGLGAEGKRVPREGCRLHRPGGDDDVGFVTSGTFSPTLDRPIAMGLVRSELAEDGTQLEAELRGKRVEVTVEGMPFYSRKRKKQTLKGSKKGKA